MDYYYVVFLSRFIVLIKICKDIFIRFEWYSDYFSLPFLFLDYNRYLKALADTGERFLHVVRRYYVLFNLHRRLRSANTAEALRQSCLVALLSPSTMEACSSSTVAERSASISAKASLLTGSE